MTEGDRTALEALNSRFDHTAAIARLVARHTNVDGEIAGALEGIASTLDELSSRLDAIVSGSAA